MGTTLLERFYWVSVRNVYIALVKSETGGTVIYEDDIYEAETVKQIGLTPKNANLDIYASGKLLDSINKNQGTDIALDVTSLPNWLMAKLQGSEHFKGGTIENVTDFPVRFALGYSIDASDGGFHAAWCPICKLQPPNRTAQTSTDSITEPKESYTIKCIPTSKGYIDFEYNTHDAAKGGLEPLTIEDFFAKPISTKEEFDTLLNTAQPIEPTP